MNGLVITCSVIVLIIIATIIIYIIRKKLSDNYVTTDKNINIQLYQMMRDFNDIAGKNNLKYWITAGTLIGAIRHKGIIPWDDDIDIGIRDEDINKLLSLKSQFESLNYEISEFSLFGYKIYPKDGILITRDHETYRFPFLDIFVYKKEGEKYVFSSERAIKEWPKEIFDVDSVENRFLYQFGNMHVWGPSNPCDFLSKAYGSEWYTKGYYSGNHNSSADVKIWYLKDDEYNCGKPDNLSKSRI